jgi:XRE family transcriptional regulator, regulator of sulfur utilization
MNRIGERVKRNREKLNMPLSDLSKKVGISVSALSQIENAKAFPSIITLKSIAESLLTTVGELVGENETLTKNPLIKSYDVKFVKKNESGTSLNLLSHHDNSKQMEPFLLNFPVGSDAADIMTEHSGQGFVQVIEGKLKMTLGEKEYLLEKGDNFYYNTNIAHGLKNTGKTPAAVLWIITPPFI